MTKSKRLTASDYDEMVMDTIMRTTIRAPRLHAATAADNTDKSPSPTAKPTQSTAAKTLQVTPSPASKRSGKKKAAAAAATAAEEADWLAETIAARAPPSPQAQAKKSSPKKAKTNAAGNKSPSKIPHKRGRGAAKAKARAKTTAGTSRRVRFVAEPSTGREKYRRPALLGALAATAATGLYCRAAAGGWIASRRIQPPPAHPLVKTRDQIRKVFRSPTHDAAGGAKARANATPAPVVQRFGGAVFDASIAGIVAVAADKDGKATEEEKGTKQNSKAAAPPARAKDKEKLHKIHKKGATHKHRLAQKLDTEARREFWSEVRREQKEHLTNLRRGVGEKVRGVGGFLKRTVKKDSDALFL